MHTERLKISQDVAAALAHELRNPVFAIASAAQLLRYRITDDPVVEKNIGRIMREAERLNTLVSALVDYGRPAPVRRSRHDPDAVWAHVIESHRGELEAKAILVKHTPAKPRATCEIDNDQLAQAFAAVLTNAVEAAPEGSDLSIISTSDGKHWTSTIHNGGPPIPANVLPRVFEPLVGTKPGQPGIGLAVAQRIVTDHDGSVDIESADGAGTTLAFSLPAVHA
jgi:signal transduction histidine kinase